MISTQKHERREYEPGSTEDHPDEMELAPPLNLAIHGLGRLLGAIIIKLAAGEKTLKAIVKRHHRQDGEGDCDEGEGRREREERKVPVARTDETSRVSDGRGREDERDDELFLDSKDRGVGRWIRVRTIMTGRVDSGRKRRNHELTELPGPTKSGLRTLAVP